MEPKVDVDALLSLCEALRTDLNSSDTACKNWIKRYEQIREEYRSLVLVVVDMETLLEDLEIIATVLIPIVVVLLIVVCLGGAAALALVIALGDSPDA